MKNIFLFIFTILGVFLSCSLFAQKNLTDSTLVQFSGVVVQEVSEGEIAPIPFANIYIPESGRGTYTNLDGFFSIVARQGDIIEFSAVGFQKIEYTIPDTLSTNRYSIVQLMSEDTIMLPEATIYPWPSREHFKEEFLALERSEERRVGKECRSRWWACGEEKRKERTHEREVEEGKTTKRS